MAEKDRGIKVVETFTNHMPVVLTDERRKELQTDLIRCTREETQIEKAKKDYNENAKTELIMRQNQRRHAAEALHLGKEMQGVLCRKEIDSVKCCLRIVRVEDNHVLSERALTADELAEARQQGDQA